MWLLFAILPPILFGVTNFTDKFLVEKKIRDPIIITIFGAFPSLAISIIILAIQKFPMLPLTQAGLILLSGFFLEVYLVPYFMALKLEDASRIVPMFQFIPIFVLIFSFLFLGESLYPKQLIGFLLIFVGSYILGSNRLGSEIFKLRKALFLMIISSLFFSFTGVIFKFVALRASFWTTIAYQFLGVFGGALFLLTWPAYRLKFAHDAKSATWQVWSLLSFGELLVLLAQLSLSWAYLLAPIAIVSVIGSMQPLFVLLYGVILSVWFPHIVKEDIQKSTILTKLVAIILIISGIAIINL